MESGILLNAAISLTGGVAYLVLASRRAAAGARRARWVFATVVGLHLALAGARQSVAFLAATPGSPLHALPVDLERADLAIFYVTTVAGSLTVIPLAYAATELVAPRRAGLVAGALLALATVGLALFFRAPVSGPHASPWGSDWAIEGGLTRAFLAGALALPAGLAIAAHLRSRGPDAARDRALGAAALVYYLAIVPDALGMTGVPFILARLAAAGSVVLAWEALARPQAERALAGAS